MQSFDSQSWIVLHDPAETVITELLILSVTWLRDALAYTLDTDQ